MSILYLLLVMRPTLGACSSPMCIAVEGVIPAIEGVGDLLPAERCCSETALGKKIKGAVTFVRSSDRNLDAQSLEK